MSYSIKKITATFFFALLLLHQGTQAAFFNIKSSEKTRMITCGMSLYLKKMGIDCAQIDKGVSQKMYEDFIAMLQKSQSSEALENHKKPETKELPEQYKTFEKFKETITGICTKGVAECNDLKEKTAKRGSVLRGLKNAKGVQGFKDAFKREKCNEYCSANTCKDPFTIATCYAMKEAGICQEKNVKNCLEKNQKNLVEAVNKREWPQEWAVLEKNWEKIFLATASEPAKGKHLGLRFAQLSAATAALAALPFVIHVVAPAASAVVFAHAGAALHHYLVTKVATKVHDAITDKVQDVAEEALLKKMGKITEYKEKILEGCLCKCPLREE